MWCGCISCGGVCANAWCTACRQPLIRNVSCCKSVCACFFYFSFYHFAPFYHLQRASCVDLFASVSIYCISTAVHKCVCVLHMMGHKTNPDRAAARWWAHYHQLAPDFYGLPHLSAVPQLTGVLWALLPHTRRGGLDVNYRLPAVVKVYRNNHRALGSWDICPLMEREWLGGRGGNTETTASTDTSPTTTTTSPSSGSICGTLLLAVIRCSDCALRGGSELEGLMI